MTLYFACSSRQAGAKSQQQKIRQGAPCRHPQEDVERGGGKRGGEYRMGAVNLGIPGDFGEEEQRCPGGGSQPIIARDLPCRQPGEHKTEKEKYVLKQRDGKNARPEEVEEEHLQPAIERRLRIVTPVPFLRECELLGFIEFERVPRYQRAQRHVQREIPQQDGEKLAF